MMHYGKAIDDSGLTSPSHGAISGVAKIHEPSCYHQGMRRLRGSVLMALTMATTIFSCGGTSSGTGDGGSTPTDGGAGGSCAAPDFPRSESGACGSGYGIENALSACCKPCSGADAGSLLGCATSDAGSCPAYDDTGKACMTAADCGMVSKGCHCGAQPVIGVSKSILGDAIACEADAMAHCALGCPSMPGQIAEDGKNNQDGGTITVLCDMKKCHTVLQLTHPLTKHRKCP